MNPVRLSLLLTALLLLTFALVAHPTTSVRGIVLYSDADVEVRQFVRDLDRAGVPATTNPRRLLAERTRGMQVIVLTPSVLPSIDKRALAFMYADGAMLVGLDMHARELQALVSGSASSGLSAPSHTFFSMIQEDVLPGACGSFGSFEDNVESWDVAGFILHSAREVVFARNSCQ